MKRTLIFMACILASVVMQAQEESNDYIPFVQNDKVWHVVRSAFNEGYHFEQYMLSGEEVVKDDKTYMKMYRSENNLTAIYDAALLREESRKVYIFDTDRQKEFLMFDYSLKAGDTYETYSYDEQKMVTYKVLSVNDFTEGPEVIRYDNDKMPHRYLRKWMVCRTDDNSNQKTWIEGVGSLEYPLANLYDERPISSRRNLAYVEYYDVFSYLPFSFHNELGQIYGCNLPTGEAYHSDDWHDQLTYELEGDRLHVYGKVLTQCGPFNYIYFYERETDDPLVHKIEIIICGVEPLADCMSLHATDFYVPGFNPNMNYIVVIRGEEYPVINKNSQEAYRPLVEEGKVWQVGAVNSGNPVQWVEYFYFDGDTIIDGKTCKQMMCQRYVSPDYPEYDYISKQPSLSYVGAWYEEDKKVYEYDSTNQQFKLMYDFSVDDNATLQINGQSYVIGPRQTGGIKGFKGVYRDVMMCKEGGGTVWSTPWLEGVGGIYGMTTNVIDGELADPEWFLMSCSVGDEVIYFYDEYEDGATPEGMNAKKRFDFTHTIKTQPKTPMRRVAEQSLYGEYNTHSVVVNLYPLDETYQVRITDQTGKVFYEKDFNAGNIVGLNINISTYGDGRYTLTMENSHESFTGEFEVQTTGIEEVRNKQEVVRGSIYNLQGQRISILQKGLNIVNGRKVYVK